MKTNRILFKLGLGTVLACILLLGVGAMQHQNRIYKSNHTAQVGQKPGVLANDIKISSRLCLPPMNHILTKW